MKTAQKDAQLKQATDESKLAQVVQYLEDYIKKHKIPVKLEKNV